MDDDFSRRANVVEQKRGETVDGVKQKTRKARRKTLDVRKAAGLSLPPLAILRSAMRTHFLFANRESVDSELDAVLAVMTPRRLQDGERLFQGGGGAESLSDTCWVLVEGGLRVRAEGGSGAESVLAPGPGGCLVNPLALVAAFSPDGDAAGAGGKSGRVIEAQGDGVVLWGLQVDDFRRAVAATNLDRMADRIEFLRGTELLGQAPPHLLSQFAEAMDERSVAPGTDVVTQGDAGDEFFVITKGEVQVLLFDSVELARAGNDNPQNPLGSGCKHLATLQRGECFGEMALLKDGGTRSATVRVPFCDNGHGGGEDEDDDDEVEGVATCLVLGREHFQQLLVPPEDAGGGKSAGASGGASSNASSSGGAGKVGAATNATAATTAGLDGLAPVEDSFDAVRAALVKENRLRLLQQVPLLSSLARDDLCELLQSRSGGGGGGGGKGRRRASSSGTAGFAEAAETGLLRAYQSGDAIATAGATPETLFVIYSGCVERRKEGDEIEYLGSGEYFGVDSLFTNEPLAASFVASGIAKTEIIAFDRSCFETLLGAAAVGEMLEEHHNQHQRRQVLRSVPLLRACGFKDLELDVVASLFRYQIFSHGDAMATAGQATGALFIIFDGEAVSIGDDGRRVPYATKSFFGEECLASGDAAPCTITAVGESVTCLVLDATAFASLETDLEQKLVAAAQAKQEKSRRLSMARRLSRGGAGGGGGHYDDDECRRLSMGQDMHQELPHDLKLGDLEVVRVLGEGNYGRVKLVVHRASGFVLALKCMNKARIVQKKQTANVLREAAILHGVAHPFVLRCVTTFSTDRQIMMLLELVQAGDLWPYIYRKKVPKFRDALPRSSAGGFEPAHAAFYFACIASALEYVHSLGVAYRDLKPENITLDGAGYLKLIDFGLSKHIPFVPSSGGGGSGSGIPELKKKKSSMRMSFFSSGGGSSAAANKKQLKSFTMCGTTEYLSPEAVTGKGHDKSIDLWAMGCFLYELLVGRTPFRARQNEQTLANIVNSKKHLQSNLYLCRQGSNAAGSLIRGLLEPNPALRLGNGAMGWGAITGHAFFAEHSVDLEAMLLRQVEAPFTPEISNALDMSGFEDSDVDLSLPEKIPAFPGDQSPFADFGSTLATDSKFCSITH